MSLEVDRCPSADSSLRQDSFHLPPPAPVRCQAGDINYIRSTEGGRYLTVSHPELRWATMGDLSSIESEQQFIAARPLTPGNP